MSSSRCWLSSTPSAVVFSSPRRRSLLTPLHLLNTAALLAPQWRHLAPCLGAALTCTPVAGNLMRLGDSSSNMTDQPSLLATDDNGILTQEVQQSAQLASQLFFQLIRESPIHVTRTKSMPAAYLTPSIVGTLLGCSLTQSNESEVRRLLRDQHGIKSNYINHNQWTGVSLTRWTNLVPSSCDETDLNGHHSLQHPFVSSLWLVVLWELASSKHCMLDFLESCNRVLPKGESLFCPNNDLVQAIRNDPLARQEWTEQRFDPAAVSNDNAQSALDRLIFSCQNRDRSSSIMDTMSTSIEDARALEVVCASVGLQQFPVNSKPATPNGYFGYDGGDTKADCAEVTVREIIDLLLWDEHSGSFDLTRLGSSTTCTAPAELIALYQSPSAAEDSGNQWFQLLSNMPGCDYLAAATTTSPSSGSTTGHYELAPTIANISKVLRRLLFGHPSKNIALGDKDWTSLHDLSAAWTAQQVHVKSETLKHRSASTHVLIEHEIAAIRLDSSLNAIEVRMRCDWANHSGMAVVTHLRDQGQCFRKDQIESLVDLPNNDDSLLSSTLALTLVRDNITQHFEGGSLSDKNRLVLNLLSTPIGPERRGIPEKDRELEELAEQNSLQTSAVTLKAAISNVCVVAREDQELGAILLPWILSESPIVDQGVLTDRSNGAIQYDMNIEELIMSLPMDLLVNPSILDALEENWACRGRPLSRMMRWKEGKVPLLKAIRGLSSEELAFFMALNFRL